MKAYAVPIVIVVGALLWIGLTSGKGWNIPERANDAPEVMAGPGPGWVSVVGEAEAGVEVYTWYEHFGSAPELWFTIIEPYVETPERLKATPEGFDVIPAGVAMIVQYAGTGDVEYLDRAVIRSPAARAGNILVKTSQVAAARGLQKR